MAIAGKGKIRGDPRHLGLYERRSSGRFGRFFPAFRRLLYVIALGHQASHAGVLGGGCERLILPSII